MPIRRTFVPALALALLTAAPALARDNAPTTGGTCTCSCLALNGQLMDSRVYQSQGFACSRFEDGPCSIHDPEVGIQIPGRTFACGPTPGQGGASQSAPLLPGLDPVTPGVAIQRQ